MKKVEFKDRPTCSCGAKMKLIRFAGYYDEFNYWRCDNCTLNRDMQDEEWANEEDKIKVDSEHNGAYSY
jgi:hypothetical protein